MQGPHPGLPDGLTMEKATLLGIDLLDTWHEICVEVCDTEYAGRTHGSRRTYDAGCHGPKCSKGSREYGRRRTSTNPSEKYKFLDELVDFWFTLASTRYAEVRASMLEQVKTA